MMNADRLLLESMQIEMMNAGVDFYWTAMALLMLCLAVQVSVTPCGMLNSGQQLWALRAERQYRQFNQRGLLFLLDCKLQRGGANSDQDQLRWSKPCSHDWSSACHLKALVNDIKTLVPGFNLAEFSHVSREKLTAVYNMANLGSSFVLTCSKLFKKYKFSFFQKT